MNTRRRKIWLAPGLGDDDEGAGPSDQGWQLRKANLQPQGRHRQPGVSCEPAQLKSSWPRMLS